MVQEKCRLQFLIAPKKHLLERSKMSLYIDKCCLCLFDSIGGPNFCSEDCGTHCISTVISWWACNLSTNFSLVLMMFVLFTKAQISSLKENNFQTKSLNGKHGNNCFGENFAVVWKNVNLKMINFSTGTSWDMDYTQCTAWDLFVLRLVVDLNSIAHHSEHNMRPFPFLFQANKLNYTSYITKII